MKIAVDLHIHSALSPCGDDDMTPNNIVNMAILKGLDVISVTDHNSCDNLDAVMEVAGDSIVVIPGMEVQSREEVHLLCYFYSLDGIKKFDSYIKGYFSNILNKSDIFGHQYIMDKYDNIIGERREMLLSSLNLSIDDVVCSARQYGGVVVPAHVDRPAYSIISQLGFIPDHLNFTTLEISHLNTENISNLYGFRHISSSDAHFLEHILERQSFIEVQDKSIKSVLDLLSSL
ncbi:MAG: PHP domain-containing protein [Xylanivirga thermophila]|jgi:3',5'-nucleoside bisphosphate phosphatase|uniref:PHP domain-containing protein n=1 Tax=Xylanivirga thermophila TaxID=2496273 RepID=UPI00101CFA20|nr:PHP domain-containing protein [Xylanivirga thermophila]